MFCCTCLTSSGGGVIEVKAGEADAIPKGWKGHWSRAGYAKFYAVRDPDTNAKSTAALTDKT